MPKRQVIPVHVPESLTWRVIGDVMDDVTSDDRSWFRRTGAIDRVRPMRVGEFPTEVVLALARDRTELRREVGPLPAIHTMVWVQRHNGYQSRRAFLAVVGVTE